MQIIDLTEEHEQIYFCCLQDWSDEMKEAGDHKERWYRLMQDEGVRVKLSVDDSREVGGMIQYIPIEKSHVEGRDLYFIYCIWVQESWIPTGRQRRHCTTGMETVHRGCITTRMDQAEKEAGNNPW